MTSAWRTGALRLITAEFSQYPPLPLGLNALGHDLQAQGFGQVDEASLGQRHERRRADDVPGRMIPALWIDGYADGAGECCFATVDIQWTRDLIDAQATAAAGSRRARIRVRALQSQVSQDNALCRA